MQILKRDFNKCDLEPLPTVTYVNPCSKYLDEVAYHNAQIRHNQQLEELTSAFQKDYYAHCMSALETLTVQ